MFIMKVWNNETIELARGFYEFYEFCEFCELNGGARHFGGFALFIYSVSFAK